MRCAADTSGHGARVGKTVYRVQLLLRYMIHSYVIGLARTVSDKFTARTRRGSPGVHAHAPRTRRLCLCRPRPSPPSSLRLLQLCFSSLSDAAGWRARVRALAMLRLELLPVRHGGKEGLTRLHRRRSSLQGLRRCRRGLRGEDGVGSFRSRTLGGVLERRDMIDQELEKSTLTRCDATCLVLWSGSSAGCSSPLRP